MILSASRRTDIPCYYAEWFMRRLREGYALTRNPMNHAQISRIPLNRDVVDCIVFWTKDPHNLLPYLDELDSMGYPYYFQFTLTPYDQSIEQVRPKVDIEETFIALSQRIGKDRVLWRYDPILLNEACTIDFHKAQFERLCKKLSPHTEKVTVSFIDTYKKNKSANIREMTMDEIEILAESIGLTAKKYGLSAVACCEKLNLSPYGIEKASCIDQKTIEKLCGYPLNIKQDKNQRVDCGCIESIDIGAYNTCLNGCVYCYATASLATAQKNHALHKPENPLLRGSAKEGEKVVERKVKSHR